ncbi:MAG: AbrB/MazE/SpoVT family DNA-binding domain-containing protein [Actinomycetota bacterium]
MTHRVGPKGQVVIPKAIREHLGINPGDEVVFVEDGDEVRVRRAVDARELAGLLRGAGAAEQLLAERRHDREEEERDLRVLER